MNIRRPDIIGALVGKAAATTKIASQTTASRSKHLGDFDALAVMLGPADRSMANLSRSEGKTLRQLVSDPELSKLGAASIQLLLQS